MQHLSIHTAPLSGCICGTHATASALPGKARLFGKACLSPWTCMDHQEPQAMQRTLRGTTYHTERTQWHSRVPVPNRLHAWCHPVYILRLLPPTHDLSCARLLLQTAMMWQLALGLGALHVQDATLTYNHVCCMLCGIPAVLGALQAGPSRLLHQTVCGCLWTHPLMLKPARSAGQGHTPQLLGNQPTHKILGQQEPIHGK